MAKQADKEQFTEDKSEICFKIEMSGRYVLIQSKKYMIDGQPHYIFTFNDISDKLHILEQNKEKLHSMIQLAQVVHDLKTPMSCIKLTINLVRMMIEDQNPEVTQLIKNINVSFEFIFQMIEDIQDLAKFSND